MARYTKDFPLLEDPNISFTDIYNYLIQEGYDYEERDGENVFRKGNGWVTAPTFVKVAYGPNYVRLESWIKMAILPGVFVGEYGMDGFVGFAGKGNMKKAVKWIEQRLSYGQPAQPAYEQPAYAQAAYQDYAQNYAGGQELPYDQDISKGDYRRHYASPKFYKDMRSMGIFGYVLCVIGLVSLLISGPIALVDTAIQLGLVLGCHLGKSKGCSIALICYGVFNVVVGLAVSQTPTGWGWLVLGIGFFNVINKVDKEYKQRFANRNEYTY